MASKSGQRFIKQNRAPRVHIEYEAETYGSLQKVELPFVMGVMSDLSGKSLVEKKSIEKREFVDFDMDNFDKRMAAIAPRAVFAADNNLTGSGKVSVDLTFNSMEDFSPDQIARNVPELRKLLEASEQLGDLLSAIDGKEGAQELLDRVLKDPVLLKAISAERVAREPVESLDGPRESDGDAQPEA